MKRGLLKVFASLKHFQLCKRENCDFYGPFAGSQSSIYILKYNKKYPLNGLREKIVYDAYKKHFWDTNFIAY